MIKKKHFLFFCSPSFLLAQKTIKIWDETKMEKKQKRSELTIYLPEKEKNSKIPVIICPGGSYCYLGMKKEGHEVAEFLQSQGIAAFVLRYRVGINGNRHPAMIQDLQRAIQLVRENADSYGIDADKLGVIGFSAGGHLTGISGTYFDTNFMKPLGINPQKSLKPAFIAMIYPVTTMQQENIVHKKSRKNLLGQNQTQEMEDYMSLEKHVREDMPPVFLLHCERDKVVDYHNSQLYKDALAEKNVSCKYLLYKEMGHGFGIQPNGQTTGWQHELTSWIKSTVKGKELC